MTYLLKTNLLKTGRKIKKLNKSGDQKFND